MELIRDLSKVPRSVKMFGAIALSIVAAFAYQVGRDVKTPGEPTVDFRNPATWIAGPVAQALESTGIVDEPSQTHLKR